jgi:hypothetical protein
LFADGAFDEAVAAGKAEGEKNKLSWLAGATLVLGSSASLFRGSDAYSAQLGFSGKGFVKASLPDVAQIFVSYALDHSLMLATNDAATRSGMAASQPDLGNPKFQLSEFYLSFDFSKVLFVRVGNQLLAWGASYFWSPADFVNQRPSDSQAVVDTRAGKTGIRLHLPLQGANLFAFADFSRSVSGTGQVRDLADSYSTAFRADVTLSPFNIGLNGAFGPGLPVRLGATAAGSLGGFDLWAEYGMDLPVYGYGFSWAASLGTEKTFGQDSEWRVRAEGFANSRGKDDAELAASAVFVPYYLGKYYVYLYGAREKLFGGSSVISLSGIMNLSDLSFIASAGLALKLPSLIPLNFTVRYNGGQAGREFTQRTAGAAWSLGIQTVLSL